MAEKDMHSSPSARASKLQLAVEQPLTGGCWNPPQKYIPCPKTKKAQWNSRRSTTTIKSNPIPAGLVTHKLENNNTKGVFPLLWRFWTPCQASQPGDPTKRLGIPRESDLEGQQDLIIGLSLDSGKQSGRLQSWMAQTKSRTQQERGKKQRPCRRLNQNYLLVLEGLLWRHGSSEAHHRDRGHGRSNPGRSSLV